MQMENRERICFVIMGFGKKQDPYTNRTIDLDATYNKIIQPSVVACVTNASVQMKFWIQVRLIEVCMLCSIKQI